jgi:Family of unknown function (DUF5684)
MSSTLAIFLQPYGSNPAGSIFSGTALLFWLVVAVVLIIGWWKVFEKAGHPGWAVLIPVYNAYVMLKIAGRPGWWLLLYFIPVVNFVIVIVVAIDIAKAFGQSAAFGFFLLFLLCGIGYLILGFGDYQYQPTAA